MRISDWSSDVCSSDLIALAGGINAIDGFEGYKPLSPEAAVAAAPDVLLISPRSLDLLGGRDGPRAIPEIALTPAGREGRRSDERRGGKECVSKCRYWWQPLN